MAAQQDDITDNKPIATSENKSGSVPVFKSRTWPNRICSSCFVIRNARSHWQKQMARMKTMAGESSSIDNKHRVADILPNWAEEKKPVLRTAE